MVSRAGLEPETLINNNVGGGGGGAPSGLQLIDPATLHAATNTMDLHTPATVGSNHTQAGASQHQHGASASHPAHMSTHGGPLASHHVHPLTTAQMQSQAQQQQAAIALGELEEAMAETLYRRSQAKLMIDCFNHSGLYGYPWCSSRNGSVGTTGGFAANNSVPRQSTTEDGQHGSPSSPSSWADQFTGVTTETARDGDVGGSVARCYEG
jgi:hypothetical protein